MKRNLEKIKRKQTEKWALEKESLQCSISYATIMDIIKSLYLCTDSSVWSLPKCGTKYVLILNWYRLNNTEKRGLLFLIRTRGHLIQAAVVREKIIHNQASKAKNGQIQMHSLLLSSGISIQLTDLRQEKWGKKTSPGQLSLLLSVRCEP